MSKSNKTIAVLAAFAVFRILYIVWGPFGASPDEAHYWEWSRRLDLSYYSKGPAVAYVIALFTSVFGPNEFGIRIGAVFFSTAASYLIYLIGRDLFGSETAGFQAAVLTNITPIFSIGAILMTTDVMFLTFWAATVWAVMRAVETKGGRWWYLSGLFIGLGFLSKYTMVLVYPCIALFLLSSKRERVWFLRKEPYIGALVSLAAATPVIYWNITHGQVTIKHTMGQAHVGSGTLSVGPLFEFIGSQALLLTPLIFIGLVYGLLKCGAEGFKADKSGLKLAFFASAPLFLFFLFKGLHGKVQANWAVASYMTALPAGVWALGELYGKLSGAGKKVLRGAVLLAVATGAVASFFAYFPWTLEPLGAKRIMWGPPYNRVTGWEELGGKVSAVKDEMDSLGPTFIMSDTYQITSELALYTKGNPVTYNVYTGSRRMNQYDLWPGFEGLAGHNAIYVKGGDAVIDPVVEAAFERCDRELYTIRLADGRALKSFTIWRCYGFKGIPPIDDYNKY